MRFQIGIGHRREEGAGTAISLAPGNDGVSFLADSKVGNVDVMLLSNQLNPCFAVPSGIGPGRAFNGVLVESEGRQTLIGESRDDEM